MKHIIALLEAGIIGLVSAAPMLQTSNPTYFFTFGNSYTMTSFNVSGEQPSASNPMGNPALGNGTTAGGPNWVGYLTTQQNASLVLSYDLAIGGATIDNTIIPNKYPDMVSQVDTFQTTYAQKPESAPWGFDDAVFGFWIGINDAGHGYENTSAAEVVPKLMASYESLIKKIYADGGRKFLFLNVPPTSRTPTFLQQGEDVMKKHAAWVDDFNGGLERMVYRFKRKHRATTIVFYDSYAFMTKVLDSPAKYGFPDATCINGDGTSCVWYNDYHPGQKFHQLQAEDMKKHLGSLGAW